MKHLGVKLACDKEVCEGFGKESRTRMKKGRRKEALRRE
jgi:hypothetical protein